MKNEAQRIADQLKRAFDGEAWHGPSLQEALDGVKVEQAVKHPIAAAHSIWEITAHIAAWEKVVGRRLGGEAVSAPPEDFPAPPTGATQADWEALTAEAFRAHAALVEQIAALTPDDLVRRIDEKPYPAWFMAHGAVAHVTYHVGQIVLLKRAL